MKYNCIYIFGKEDIIMGDMVKRNTAKSEKKSLEEKVAERESKKQKTVHNENETIENIAKRSTSKDKPISARVNGTTYTNFKKICEKRGLTSNAALNMLISDFVLENKHILE